jgi:hypothetical protein
MNLKSAFDLFKTLFKTLFKLRSSLSSAPLLRIHPFKSNLSKFLFLVLGVSLSGIFFLVGISKTSDSRETWAGTVTYSRGIHGTNTYSDEYYVTKYEQHLDETATVNVTLEYTHSDESEDYFEGKSLSGNYFFNVRERVVVTSPEGESVIHNKKAQCGGALSPYSDGSDGVAEVLLVVDRETKTYTLNIEIESPICDGTYTISPGGASLEYFYSLTAPFPYYEGAVEGKTISGSWTGPPAELWEVIIPPGGKMPGASFNWNFSKAGDYKVKITKPKEDEQFVFSGNEELDVWSEAEADPEDRNDSIQPWSIDPIEGSELKTEPDPPVGQTVLFRFSGLPDDNNQFGQKTIKADNARPVTIKAFFSKRYEKEGKPNWFRYWKQGAVPDMEDFEYDRTTSSYGYFRRPNTLALGRRASKTCPGITITIKKPKLKFIIIPTLKGVDNCHSTVLHERMHKTIYEKYHLLPDSDGDGLPDAYEILTYLDYGFDNKNPDTHDMKRISPSYASYGDQEVLCREAELGHSAKHELDWAFPGKQSDPEY